jgi:dihydrofolate reductase
MNLIVALDSKNGIAKNGSIPWNITLDMKFFAQKTKGNGSRRNAVIMGRKTWESIPEKHRPLKERFSVVFSRRDDGEICQDKDLCTVVHRVSQCVNAIQNFSSEDVFVIGGSEIYRKFLSYCKFAYITRLEEDYHCDTFFPNMGDKWVLSSLDREGENVRWETWQNLDPLDLYDLL